MHQNAFGGHGKALPGLSGSALPQTQPYEAGCFAVHGGRRRGFAIKEQGMETRGRKGI